MTFHARGALSPTNPLFRGREAELTRLVQLCQEDVSAYVIVYGGRQTGKTSLLLQLEHRLQQQMRVCRVDFQGLPQATAPQMYRFLARRIASVLPLTPDADTVTDPPSLVQFLTQTLGSPDVHRLVVLLDELGTLPDATRDELGNVLRSMFHTRLINPALAKLQIVLTGGIELHHLVVAEVSTLHNICEEIYLGDLSEADGVALVADGLEQLTIARADGEQVARLLQAQGEDAAARPLYRRACLIWIQALGMQHPTTQTGLGNFLGLLLAERGLDPAAVDHETKTQILTEALNTRDDEQETD